MNVQLVEASTQILLYCLLWLSVLSLAIEGSVLLILIEKLISVLLVALVLIVSLLLVELVSVLLIATSAYVLLRILHGKVVVVDVAWLPNEVFSSLLKDMKNFCILREVV